MNTQTQPPALDARRWLTFFLDLLYPLRCGGCGTAGKELWCESCDALVQRLYLPQQSRNLQLPAPWDAVVVSVVSAAVYTSSLREAIHAFKYDGVPHLAKPLALLLIDPWHQSGMHADLLVPVPLHPRRKRERGYNQSEWLARELGERVGVPVNPRALQRVRYTDQQALLGPDERKLNVHDAFRAIRELTNGKQIVLVDDVFTTGATLSECAMALLAGGAQRVSALTLARAG